jgi:hypothetical protein
MKVEFKQGFRANMGCGGFGQHSEWNKGDVDDIPNVRAERWIASGVAKPYYPVQEDKVMKFGTEYEVKKNKAGWVYLIHPDGREDKVGRGEEDYKKYLKKYVNK